MSDILLCSNNPILIKSLYGILRDEGYGVDVADHPSLAVRRALQAQFGGLIMDSEPFGLSADDAAKIIKTLQPEIVVIFVGCDSPEPEGLSLEVPIDLVEFKRVVRAIHHCDKILSIKEERKWH